MKKITEKIAVVAQVCISLIFALTAILYMSNIIPQYDNLATNGVFTALIIIMFVLYVLLSIYLLYVNFSNRENLKRIMLYCSSESATQTNVKVVKDIVKKCADKVNGIKIKKIKIKTDENNGFVMTVKVKVTAATVSEPIDKLHCLLADSFENVLGLTFNSINFEVERFASNYSPDITKAVKQAEEIAEQRERAAEMYNEPLPNHDDEKKDTYTADVKTEEPEKEETEA